MLNFPISREDCWETKVYLPLISHSIATMHENKNYCYITLLNFFLHYELIGCQVQGTTMQHLFSLIVLVLGGPSNLIFLPVRCK